MLAGKGAASMTKRQWSQTMRTLVVYYSLSGATRTLAQAIAHEIGADLEEIRCGRYRLGPWGYLRAAYDSLVGRLPAIEAPQRRPADYDLVLIGAPIWTAHPATPVRSWLRSYGGAIRKAGFFVTLGGAPADKTFREIGALAGRAPLATLAVRDKDVKAGNVRAAVESFVAALRAPTPA
jgi:flavodoxin